MLKLDQLQLLSTLNRVGSLHNASENLYISQPALSKSLKNLEKELGVELFNRTPKGMNPTSIGRTLITQAEEILQLVNNLYTTANNHNLERIFSNYTDTLYIHADSLFHDYYLSDFFSSLQTSNLPIKLNIVSEQNIAFLMDMANHLPNHIFLFIDSLDTPSTLPPHFNCTPLCDLEVAIKVSHHCPFYEKSNLSIEDLYAYPCAYIDTEIDIFKSFYSNIMDKITIAIKSTSPMMISRYIANHAAWTVGLLIKHQIPKKEAFFSTATSTKTIRLLPSNANKLEYQLVLVAHENTSKELIEMFTRMISNDLFADVPEKQMISNPKI